MSNEDHGKFRLFECACAAAVNSQLIGSFRL